MAISLFLRFFSGGLSWFGISSILFTVMTVVFATSAKCLPTTISPSDVVTSIPSCVTFTASMASTLINLKFLVVRSGV